MSALARLLCVAAACASLGACRRESSAPGATPSNALLSRASASESFGHPARYRYHPTKRATQLAERELADGRRLLVGKRGERWLVDAKSKTLSAASRLAPEDLIAIVDSEQGYGFVGESGTSYESREALGPFLRSTAPLTPLVRVSAARHSILGIPPDHTLSLSVDGAASFARVGPAQVTFADVELASDGTGLALAVPEALWRTTDEGGHWALLSSKTRGAFALARDARGTLRVDTVFGPQHFDSSKNELAPGVSPGAVDDLQALVPPRGPDAAALADGRAVVVSGRYFEIAVPSARPSTFELVSGGFDGDLQATPVPELKDCRAARIAGFDRYLELACFRGASDAGSVPIAFFRSDSRGARFRIEPFASYGTVAGFRFAMGAQGSLLVTGICGLPNAGCSTGGLFFRRDPPPAARAEAKTKDNAKTELFASAAPTFVESALGVTFSVDGRAAYALGRRSKTNALSLFVSHDGAKSFETRDLDPVHADEGDENQYWDASQSARLDSFAAAEDGALSLAIADRHGLSLFVTDENGRLLSASQAPDAQALIAAAGARAFAISPRTRKTWESLDGGLSWQDAPRFPAPVCDVNRDADCNLKLRCVPNGCVIGDEVSRIGWGGQPNDDDSLPPPSRDRASFDERRLRTPIACTLDDSPWQNLPSVRELPGAHDAAFGNVSFVALASELAGATLRTIHGLGTPRPHLETVTLLPPVPNPNDYAIEVLDQVEGAAGVRYRIPRDPINDSHLRNVEVAWDNVLSGQVGRARLADGGALAAGDYERGDAAHHAQPDLLSIGEGGLYLRLHHQAGDNQDTLYFDGRRTTRIPPVAWPIPNSLRGRTEMARHGEAHLALMLFGRGTAVARARRTGASFEFDAQTTSLPNPIAFGERQTSTLTYLGGSSGLFVQTENVESGAASAVYFPLRDMGPVLDPPRAVPTQLNLGDRPERCTPADRASTPRVDASFLPGTRHPIVVADASAAPRVFLSSGAVLYGTPAHACATALDGEEVALGADALRHERVLLLLDDLDHAWLFRQPEDTNGAPVDAQYRIMKCRFDPTQEVPSDVYRLPGTLVPHR